MIRPSIRDLPAEELVTSASRSYSLHQDLVPYSDPELIKSIAQFGILHPPIVLRNSSRTFEIICGLRRISAAKEVSGIQSITCLVTDSVESVDLLGLVLQDQVLAGPLSDIMKARFFKLCLSVLTVDQTRKIIASSGIGSYGQLHRLLPLLTLERPFIDLIHQGEMSEKIGREMLAIDPADRQFLAQLFQTFALNNNKQRQLLAYCRIILADKTESYRDYFDKYFPEYTDGKPENIPQAANRLLHALHEQSHPMSSMAERLFKEKTAGLRLPDQCSVDHSPAFEKDTVSLTLECDNFAELAEIWQKIKPFVKKRSKDVQG